MVIFVILNMLTLMMLLLLTKMTNYVNHHGREALAMMLRITLCLSRHVPKFAKTSDIVNASSMRQHALKRVLLQLEIGKPSTLYGHMHSPHLSPCSRVSQQLSMSSRFGHTSFLRRKAPGAELLKPKVWGSWSTSL